MAQQKRQKRVVGWKEHAALPDLKVKDVIEKMDTAKATLQLFSSNYCLFKFRNTSVYLNNISRCNLYG